MSIAVRVNGTELQVPVATTVAAAVALAGSARFRTGVVDGTPRGPLCGMGICFECRVTVDGRPHVRGCTTPCEPGMEIVTDA